MKNQRETLTTKEHFAKYHDLQKGISRENLLSSVRDLYKDVEALQNKFDLDELEKLENEL